VRAQRHADDGSRPGPLWPGADWRDYTIALILAVSVFMLAAGLLISLVGLAAAHGDAGSELLRLISRIDRYRGGS
jgi:hypothetical protein